MYYTRNHKPWAWKQKYQVPFNVTCRKLTTSLFAPILQLTSDIVKSTMAFIIALGKSTNPTNKNTRPHLVTTKHCHSNANKYMRVKNNVYKFRDLTPAFNGHEHRSTMGTQACRLTSTSTSTNAADQHEIR